MVGVLRAVKDHRAPRTDAAGDAGAGVVEVGAVSADDGRGGAGDVGGEARGIEARDMGNGRPRGRQVARLE